MSYDCDEAYDVYRETWRTARVEHRCCACRETIAVGHRYCYVAVVFDREARSYKRCAKCQATHLHLRELCRKTGDMIWPDEQLSCGLKYEDEWGPLPDEIAAIAFMTQDEAQRLAPTVPQ